METMKLTHSMRSKWNSCHRAFRIAYEDRIRPISSAASLRFGTAFHALMEVYWGEAIGNHNGDIAEKVSDVVCEYAQQNDDAYGANTLLALFDGYVHKYLDSDLDAYETIAVEQEYNAPLVNPETGKKSMTYHLAGKLDGILRNRYNGQTVILEHKTTSSDISPVSEYWKKLAIDGQVSGYYYGIMAMGYENVTNCLYDVIRKPTLKPYKATPIESRKYKKDGTLYAGQRENDETPEEWHDRLAADISLNPDRYFARQEIARCENDIQDYLYDMWAVAKEMMEAKKSGRYSRNPAGCQAFSGCEYWDVCTNSASLDDTTRFQVVETANTELSL